MAADDPRAPGPPSRPWLRAGWIAAFAVLAAVRLWNAFTGSLLRGYDDHGHVGYILYLDLYRSVPWADQGWSYFHPPLHYVFGWALAQPESPEALLHGLAFLVLFFTILTTWIWLEALPRTSWRRWVAYAACVALGMWIHLTMTFVVASSRPEKSPIDSRARWSKP